MGVARATVFVWREGKWYVAYEPISGVASQGKTREEALRNIREALELYLEESEEEIQPLEDPSIAVITISGSP